MRYGNVFLKEIRKMTKQKYLKNKNYIYKKEEDFYKKTFSFGNKDIIEYQVNGIIDLFYKTFYLYPNSIKSQKEIDYLQIAFNNLKRDFEEVQNYE